MASSNLIRLWTQNYQPTMLSPASSPVMCSSTVHLCSLGVADLSPAMLIGSTRAPRRRVNLQRTSQTYCAISNPNPNYSFGLIHNDLQLEVLELNDGDRLLEISGFNGTMEMINEVKRMLSSMGDGEISISAYDTAWVSLVPSIHGNGRPQFPSSLQWVAENQLPDGSWGDDGLFRAYDRMLNTLACVVALKTWNINPKMCDRGLEFLSDNMWRLAEEDPTLMPIGFEVAFPSLMEIARELDLKLPYDHAALCDIYEKGDVKLERIPKEVLHKLPTPLLYSLEGMPDLDWEKLLRLQCSNGSFLFSPSSTAYALIQTGDNKCMDYLQGVVDRFGGGVPNVYPVDLFERMYGIDRLERLGISQYFEAEIKECMDYVYRYWMEDGICWARDSNVADADDTTMGFRLLRLHGYDVSPDVLRNFEKENEFFCLPGQSSESVMGMFNLNRASQVLFPGEDILERARTFSYRFLREKQASNQLLDKWIITKDLPCEVKYALDFPWYVSLPRVEARVYVEQYGGGSDVWIGKTLYRMHSVSNDLYLELAKSDFNRCQAVYQMEWIGVQKWYKEMDLGVLEVNPKNALRAYFLASACIFQLEREAERLGWARTMVVAEAISAYFSSGAFTEEMKQKLIDDFFNAQIRLEGKLTGEGLVRPVYQLIDGLASTYNHKLEQHQSICRQLMHAWEEWFMTWRKGEGGNEGRWSGNDRTGMLLVRTIEACGGRSNSSKLLTNPIYSRLTRLTSSVCQRICRRIRQSHNTTDSSGIITDKEINSEMQELVQCVLQSSDGLNKLTKQTFLYVVKSYYYVAHCSSTILDNHISMVLFDPVL